MGKNARKDIHKIRICMLTTVHPVFDVRIFYKESRTLMRAGYKVIIIGPHEKPEVKEAIEIVPISKPKSRILRMMTVWKVFFKAINYKCDVYHIHDPELLPVGLLIKYFFGKKVIYDVHEYYNYTILSKYWIPSLFRRILSEIFNVSEKMLASRMDGVLTVTKHMQGIFEKYNSNIVTICNYPPKESIASNKPDLPFDRPVIIFHADMDKKRGLRTVLEAMPRVIEKHPEAHCCIIGKYNCSGLDEKYIKEFPYFLEKGKIEFMERRSLPEVYKILSKATIGWLPLENHPSNILALPIKLFEFMAFAKPIVASDLGNMSQIISESKAGILAPADDPKAHADAINYLLEHHDKCFEYGENGHKAFISRYNWDSEGDKLLEFYNKLVVKKG